MVSLVLIFSYLTVIGFGMAMKMKKINNTMKFENEQKMIEYTELQ